MYYAHVVLIDVVFMLCCQDNMHYMIFLIVLHVYTVYSFFIIVLSIDVVLTSKYRDGWCNFPSHSHKNWNSQDIGPHRDLIGNLTNSVRGKGLKMGFYHSLNEWYNPILEKVCCWQKILQNANAINVTIIFLMLGCE